MADDKKYYYLKLKDNYFESDKMIILESMQDGYLYSNILLKLYLKSLKGEGRLMFNERIPYNPTILAQITRHSVGVIEKAIQIFKEFELIEIMDNGAIYVMDIQNYIGHSSTEADRQREYQRKLKESNGKDVKMIECKKSNKVSNMIPTPEIRDKSLEINIELDNKESGRFSPPTLEEVEEYVLSKGYSVDAERFVNYYGSIGWKVGKVKMTDWKKAVATWNTKEKKKSERKVADF